MKESDLFPVDSQLKLLAAQFRLLLGFNDIKVLPGPGSNVAL